MKTVFVRRNILIAAIVAVVALLGARVVTTAQEPINPPTVLSAATLYLTHGVAGLVRLAVQAAQARRGQENQ